MNRKKERKYRAPRAFPITCIVLSVLLGVFSLFNIIISVTSLITGMPPNFFGKTPAIVYSDSMDSGLVGGIPSGSLVISDGSSIEEAEAGNVIMFFHEKYLHLGRVTSVVEKGITVKADGSSLSYPYTITEKMYLGKINNYYTGFGQFAMFINTDLGRFIFGTLPIAFCLFVLIDMLGDAIRDIKKKPKKQPAENTAETTTEQPEEQPAEAAAENTVEQTAAPAEQTPEQPAAVGSDVTA